MIGSGIFRFHRFLGGDPVRTGPESFIAAMGGIVSFASANMPPDSLVIPPDNFSEERIRERLIDTLEKARPRLPKSKVFPSILSDITLDDYRWNIGIMVTGIPNLKGIVRKKDPYHSKRDEPPAYGADLIRHMIDSGNAHVGVTGERELYGKKWQLYVYLKIRLIRTLRNSFGVGSFSGETLLVSPQEYFRGLDDTPPTILALRDEKSEIRQFLNRCDEILLDKYGKEGLDGYLISAGVSSRRFLSTQR